MRITQRIANEEALKETLKELSRAHGGAWVFSVKPFSQQVSFRRFDSPSKVPDSFLDLTGNLMAHKGQLRGFTSAATAREQNRGLGRT